ncbi:MAG: efflux RND transporter periplasmic adaptor subunit [Elusimicrobia bacterium]|nr:efflux RND transporter periplasmic adaptor subunit [Elusimicrobiota bacterium]
MFRKFLLLNLFFCLTVFVCSCSNKEQAQQEQEYVPLVNATKAISLDIPWNKEYPAQVAGSLEVEVRAQVSGILKERLYNEGEFVNKDEVLFVIDPQEYQIALKRAQASLEQANTEVKRTKRDYKRNEDLIKDNAVSRKEYDDSLSAYERAVANYNSAKSEVEDAQRNLGYAKVKAPISGIARKENYSIGNLISSTGGESLLTTMVQINPLHVKFSIPGKELMQLKDNVEAEKMSLSEDTSVDVLIGEKVYSQPGKIVFFDSVEDPQTATFAVKAEVPNPESKIDLIPGQFVRVRIKGVTYKNAILIPQSSLVETPNGTFVYVINTSSNNVVDAVPVSADIRDSIAVVYSGLKGDEMIVSGGSLKVQPGIPVNFELKDVELPEEYKQVYIEKYGQKQQQEENQPEQGQQEQKIENNEQK